VEVLLRGEFSSMVSVWNEYLCLEIRDGRPWLSHRRYEALGEIHDFEVETDEGDCEYRIPDVIDGQAVVGTEDEWVVGGELMLDPADNASEIDLTISDTLAVRRWLEERGFDRQDGFDGVWMRIEGLLVSRPGGGTNDGQAS
jgi:hypothetical protein